MTWRPPPPRASSDPAKRNQRGGMRCSDHAEWHAAPGAAPLDGFPAADNTTGPERKHTRMRTPAAQARRTRFADPAAGHCRIVAREAATMLGSDIEAALNEPRC